MDRELFTTSIWFTFFQTFPGGLERDVTVAGNIGFSFVNICSSDQVLVYDTLLPRLEFFFVFVVMTFLSIFSFVNIYFGNLDSCFLLYSLYFTSFDLRILFSTCFYHRYNFVRYGTPCISVH